MKTFATLLACCTTLALAPAAELKIGILDIQRVLKDYYKAQELTSALQQKQRAFEIELDTMRMDLRTLWTETREIQERSADPALSPGARQALAKQLDSKLGDLREFEVRYDQAKTERALQLRNDAAQAEKKIFQDVVTAVGTIGSQQGFNLILNANKDNPLASDVLFAKDLPDVTTRVIAALNLPKSAKPSSPAEKPKSD